MKNHRRGKAREGRSDPPRPQARAQEIAARRPAADEAKAHHQWCSGSRQVRTAAATTLRLSYSADWTFRAGIARAFVLAELSPYSCLIYRWRKGALGRHERQMPGPEVGANKRQGSSLTKRLGAFALTLLGISALAGCASFSGLASSEQ